MVSSALRFIHTADWQLGLRVRYIPGDAGASVRQARLRTVQAIGEAAREHGAEFVIVAGDVFEHHGLKQATVRKAFDVLKGFPVPVYLLPGNHDPLTPDALYQSDLWQRECPANVHVLTSIDPVAVRDDAFLLPCPITERQVLEDPTAHWGPGFGPSTGFRVGVAHGGIREILAGMEGDEADLGAAVSLDACERGRLDYLALGDWHGLLRVSERSWYPGTPDATRFKESHPGHVVLVDISAPGAVPEVTPLPVATLQWRQLSADLNGEADIAALERELEALPDKANTLVELELRGVLDLAEADMLEKRVLETSADRFLWVRPRDEHLGRRVDEDALAELADDGWVGDVVTTLQASPDPEAQQALQLLYRLHREVAP